MELFSVGLKSARLSDDYLRGIFHAKEKMEEIMARDDLYAISMQKGSFDDGYEWQIQVIENTSSEENSLSKGLHIGLFRVNVRVSWKNGLTGRQFSLSTLKISKKKS